MPVKVEEFVPREPDKPIRRITRRCSTGSTSPSRSASVAKDAALESRDFEGNCRFIIERIKRAYDLKTQGVLPQLLQESERVILLEAIDELWQEHLYAMDALREGVSLRSYGQKDPLIEYKQEAYIMFDELMGSINNKVLSNLFSSHQRLQMFMEHIRNTMMHGRTFGPDSQPQQPRPAQASIRRRRAGRGTEDHHPAEARGSQGRTQRTLPLRQRQEIQGLLRTAGVSRYDPICSTRVHRWRNARFSSINCAATVWAM